nr:hypothetical protein [Tanacetum cinerariifolium]
MAFLWKKVKSGAAVGKLVLPQRLPRKNELKAHGTLLMALPDKHQLKFNTHKDAKTLMEAIEKRTHTLIWRNKTDLEEQSLDDLFNSLKIYEAEVKSSSSTRTFIQNISFVSSSDIDSTNEPVSVAASVSAVSAKIPVYALPNVDSLSNAVIYLFFASQSNSTQLDNDDLKQTDANDLEEIDLKWQMAMLTSVTTVTGKDTLQGSVGLLKIQEGMSFQADEEPTNYALMAFTSSSSSFDNEVVSYSKACTKAYAKLYSYYDKMIDDYSKSQFDVISYKTGLESVEDRLLVYQQNEYVFEEEIKLLKLEVQLKDNALVVLRQNLEKAEQERGDLKLKLEKFQTSSKNLSELLASQTNAKTGLGYNSLVFTRTMFDCDDSLTSGSDESLPPNPIYDRLSAPIIKDWVSDSEDESETQIPQNVPSFVQPTEQEKSPMPFVKHVETSIPTANSKTAILNPTSNGKCKNQKACFVCKSLDYLIKDCAYHEKKLAQTTSRNHTKRGTHKQYAQMTLLNPQRHVVPAAVLTQSKLVPITVVRPVTTTVPKINVTRPIQAKTVVTKPNSPPRGNINRSPSPKACNFPLKVTAVKALMDKEVIYSGCSRHMMGNMSYLSNFEKLNGGYVAFGDNPKGGSDPTWLFDIDTLTKTIIYQPVTAGNQSNHSAGVQAQFDAEKAGEEILQQYVLFLIWSSGSTNPQNTDGDAAFDKKDPEFQGRNPESEVNVSLSKFEDFSDNSINEDNAAGTLVPSIGQLSPNSTNTFSVAGPSNTAASPTHRKSSYVDSSQLFDDPNMPELEDITYSDDEDDVGIEADFNNLETSITVSLIPTTRVHKDHNVTQIIATQIRHMTRVAKDQGRLSQINNDDFHTCMFVCFLSQEEPNRVHQALKDPNCIKAMQDELHQFKMQKVWVLVDLPHGKRAIGTKWVFRNKKDERGIVEEVYVCQPSGFEDPDYPNKVYKVVKAIYGLHQAPRAWYETLSNYLLENSFQRGKIDQTLFIKRQKDEFNGELTFFLGLQVKQKKDGLFISQDKYVAEILRKFGLTDGKSASTPIDIEKPLLKDPDVKKIFRYLKGKPQLGLWYPKDAPFNLVAYSDSDYASASLDRKSTTEGCQFLGCRLIS